MKKTSLTYAESGVNYEVMDPFKRLAQVKALTTSANLSRMQMVEVEGSRGESAYVWDEGDSYKAFVIEGLGTKNMVADEMRKTTGKTYYDQIAQDTVGAIVNDLIVVGADPLVINAYFAVGDSGWFKDEIRTSDLVNGWAKACDLAGATWGGGETPTLKDMINPHTIELGGSGIGIIKPKTNLVLGERLSAGDAILLIESSGIHANGLTLVRAIGAKLPKGFATKLPNGEFFGEAVLKPTIIYASVVRQLFADKLDIHYMVNITGHGWRKLMRAKEEFVYVIEKVPTPSPIFEFIQRQSGNSDEEMYGNFNMGAGFAVFLPQNQAEKAVDVAKKMGLKTTLAGYVDQGKQVSIKPKNIIFQGKSLGVR